MEPLLSCVSDTVYSPLKAEQLESLPIQNSLVILSKSKSKHSHSRPSQPAHAVYVFLFSNCFALNNVIYRDGNTQGNLFEVLNQSSFLKSSAFIPHILGYVHVHGIKSSLKTSLTKM